MTVLWVSQAPGWRRALLTGPQTTIDGKINGPSTIYACELQRTGKAPTPTAQSPLDEHDLARRITELLSAVQIHTVRPTVLSLADIWPGQFHANSSLRGDDQFVVLGKWEEAPFSAALGECPGLCPGTAWFTPIFLVIPGPPINPFAKPEAWGFKVQLLIKYDHGVKESWSVRVGIAMEVFSSGIDHSTPFSGVLQLGTQDKESNQGLAT